MIPGEKDEVLPDGMIYRRAGRVEKVELVNGSDELTADHRLDTRLTAPRTGLTGRLASASAAMMRRWRPGSSSRFTQLKRS